MIKIGDRVDNRYHITGRIAHGGMADVYEAMDTINHRTVSLKVMREDMMADPMNVKRFNRECIAAASLNNPNIVKVYGQGIIDGRPYMANEYIKGQTLRDKLNFSPVHNLSPLESCEVMLQLTSGVQYIHEHGIIHRDIKPDNLFLSKRWFHQDRRLWHFGGGLAKPRAGDLRFPETVYLHGPLRY
jgi:serine/threonine protein kinase